MDPAWLVISEDPEGDMAELCYIPTLGGGFAGLTWAGIERWPLSRKYRMLDWLRNRRDREAKALSGKGSAGAGPRDPQGFNPPSGPTLSQPGPP